MFPSINFNKLDISKLNRIVNIKAKVIYDIDSPLKFKIILSFRQY